jgi:predicted methyltransferase
MSVSTEEIFISLKRNGFDISLLEVEKILARLVEEGYIDREMPSALEWTERGSECVTVLRLWGADNSI